MKPITLKKKQSSTMKKDTGKMTATFQTTSKNTYQMRDSITTIFSASHVILITTIMKRANIPTTAQVTAATASIMTTHIATIVMKQYQMTAHITQRSHNMITVNHATTTTTDTATDAEQTTG